MAPTFLLIPDAEDRHGLLSGGICGARPPTLDLAVRGGQWAIYDARRDDGVCDATGLVLVYWDAVAHDACDRVSRALRQRLRHAYTRAQVHELASAYVRHHGGRMVLLDLDGREVTE